LKVFNPRIGMDALQVTPISKANSNQVCSFSLLFSLIILFSLPFSTLLPYTFRSLYSHSRFTIALRTCRKNRSRSMLPPLHRIRLPQRNARKHHPRNPTHQFRKRRFDAEVTRNQQLARIRIHGSTAARQFAQFDVSVVGVGCTGQCWQSHTVGEEDG
jgi:hypothetical protein